MGTGQVSLHLVDVRFPSTDDGVGPAGLLHRVFGLDGGQVEEVVEHLLVLGLEVEVGLVW